MNNKKLILAAIALVAIIAVLAGVYLATRSGPAAAGAKAITVTVVLSDGSEKVSTTTPMQKSWVLIWKSRVSLNPRVPMPVCSIPWTVKRLTGM